MNTIFLKEVAESVLKGKLVKLNYTNIGNEECIIEINISNKVKKCINNSSTKTRASVITDVKKLSWLNRLYTKYTLIRFKKDITKTINKNDLIGYSIVYSSDIKKNKDLIEYLENIFSLLSINEYINISSIEENLDKHIEEYINKNGINKENISPLIIVNDTRNLKFDLINNLNKKYKEINIYTDIKPNKQFLNRLKNINDEYGSCISVLTKPEKNFKKYNICILVDKPRSYYTRFKFSKKTCFIDFTNKENDRFNEKYIKLEDEIKSHNYNGAKIKEMYQLYGKITVATVIIS